MAEQDFIDKKIVAILYGGQPPNPRSLTHYRPKYEINKKKAVHKSTASYFGHLLGARVALQRCPILTIDDKSLRVACIVVNPTKYGVSYYTTPLYVVLSGVYDSGAEWLDRD